MFRDYSRKGVQFYYIYKSLAHPGTNGFISPFTLRERLLQVREAQRRLKSRVSWLCDTMDNDLKHALGNAPNSEFVIDPQGRIVRKRQWSRPRALRKDLESLVGPVDHPTSVDELGLPTPAVDQPVYSGVVPRVKLSARMRPLVVRPHLSGGREPFYVKLRAEADSALLDRNTGKLYLGFFLDPLYAVHWNNAVEPLTVEISEIPPGWHVTPETLRAPAVERDADIDPREFLLDVSFDNDAERGADATFSVTVSYCACDDAQTFCIPLQQRYTVQLAVDRDRGSRISR